MSFFWGYVKPLFILVTKMHTSGHRDVCSVGTPKWCTLGENTGRPHVKPHFHPGFTSLAGWQTDYFLVWGVGGLDAFYQYGQTFRIGGSIVV